MALGFWEFADEIMARPEDVRRTAQATVVRIDDQGVVWCSVPGGVDEFPATRSTSTCHAGDTVTVEILDGTATITGNQTDKSASSTQLEQTASTAVNALQSAAVASNAADVAQQLAEVAQGSAAVAVQAASDAYDAAQSAIEDAADAASAASDAQASATSAQNYLKSVVRGATTVEKAVSVMQTALEAVVDYDPTNDTVQEYFWHDANGAHVLGDTSGYRNDISSTGMDIVEVTSEDGVAHFGADGAQIGKDDESHLEMDYHSMQLVSKEGRTYFHVSDLRGQNGTLSVVDHFKGTGRNHAFTLTYTASSTSYSVSVSDGSGGTLTKRTYEIYFSEPPTDGASIRVDYATESEKAKALSFGSRIASEPIGSCSAVIGDSNAASGITSFAQGMDNVASGTYSRAFGFASIASGFASRADGYKVNASSIYQTAIGKYNAEDANDTYALIVGNGTADNARSNAMTLGWDGVLRCANVGAYYTAAWTASSSSANNTTLTDELLLPAGTYLVSVGVPATSGTNANDVYVSINVNGSASGRYCHGPAYASATFLLTLASASSVQAVTGSSMSYSFSYLNRGYLTAVRIA